MSNIFDNIPLDLSDEVFENIIAKQPVKIERIISKGHSSPSSGWYEQPQQEWVLLLKGAAIIDFDHQPAVHLKEGDYLTINAHQKHKVSWTPPNIETIWLAIHF